MQTQCQMIPCKQIRRMETFLSKAGAERSSFCDSHYNPLNFSFFITPLCPCHFWRLRPNRLLSESCIFDVFKGFCAANRERISNQRSVETNAKTQLLAVLTQHFHLSWNHWSNEWSLIMKRIFFFYSYFHSFAIYFVTSHVPAPV